jgi:hypothetical protein
MMKSKPPINFPFPTFRITLSHIHVWMNFKHFIVSSWPLLLPFCFLWTHLLGLCCFSNLNFLIDHLEMIYSSIVDCKTPLWHFSDIPAILCRMTKWKWLVRGITSYVYMNWKPNQREMGSKLYLFLTYTQPN